VQITTGPIARTVQAVALMGVTAGIIAAAFAADHDGERGGETINVGEGQDRFPNLTVQDWVTYADHVVVVTPTAEKEELPAESELERGEGLINRDVTLKVNEVLWSQEGAEQPAPETFGWAALGWQFSGGDTSNRNKMAADDQPRIELGHTYIMAITWKKQWCSPGTSDYDPARWVGLGVDSALPYDGGVIGAGELEGTVRTSKEAKSAAVSPNDPNYSFEDAMTGLTAQALAAELAEAKPLAAKVRAPEPTQDETTDCG